ncbi:MAG: cyclodeaminase/cyclohydrolase family protein [Planctomycetota bacterium]|nr:cyclodeaminase/cyclohydrolase family protein [Planctomycetota bacterium]
MIDQSFAKLVESMAARTPTPGGGAAAAMSGCLGASLLLMVVRFSRGKKANESREADLAAAEDRLQSQLDDLMPMAERDCESYDLVSKAYGLPKETDEQKDARKGAIQEAMVGAMTVPEQTLNMVHEVFNTMDKVVDCVGKSIGSDLASGGAMLSAAAEGAFLNVRINAAYLDDRELAESTMARATAVRDAIRQQHKAVADLVDQLLG